MRVFYVVMIQDAEVASCLDAIRFIANPLEKRCAHITVRGPYKQHYRMTRLNSLIRRSVIRVDGCGQFSGLNQNTVFLRCDSPELKEAWNKPDYGVGYNPHITIYDGKSREFADQLVDILKKYKLDFCFYANSLLPLESVKGQRRWDLSLSFDRSLVSSIIGDDISPSKVSTLTDDQRLHAIEKVYQYLCSLMKLRNTLSASVGS